MPENAICVTVCYAQSAGQVWCSTVSLASGSTIADAIAASGVLQACNIPADGVAGIGVFGIRKPGDHVLQSGDRVEVYRKLVFDPMESRRRRATHRKAGILKRKHLKKSKVAWQEYMETASTGDQADTVAQAVDTADTATEQNPDNRKT